MPRRKDTVLSSEEESDGTVYSRRTPNKNSGEEDSSPERVPSSTEKARQTSGEKSAVSRQTKEARKMAAARRDGEGTAPKSPQCLGIPGQGSEIAAAAPESQSLTVAELQEGGKLSLKDLKTEIFSYVKGAFQQEKASMREEMIALYREQVYQPSSPPNSSRASPTRQTIREKKRANPTWQTKAALKKPRLSPALGAGDSSDADSLSREEGEVLSDIEDLEEIQVTEQSSRLFKIEDYQYLLSKAVSALHLGEAKSGEGKSKRKSTSLHKGDGKYFPSDAHSKKVFPFPEYFETQVTNEWDKPAANRRCPNFLRKLYALPAYANDILQEFKAKSKEWDKQETLYQNRLVSLDAQRKSLSEKCTLFQKQAQNCQTQIRVQTRHQNEDGPCSRCKTERLGVQQDAFTEPTKGNEFFMDKLKSTVSEIAMSRNRLQEENLKLQQELKMCQRKCQNFEARFTEVKDELRSREDLLNMVELECQQLQKEVAKMEDYKSKEDNHVKLQSAYAQCIKELETKKVEMLVLEQRCENQQKELHQIRDRLYQEAQSHRSEVERMRTEISDLTGELHQKEITIATIAEKAALLERQLQMKPELKEKMLGKQQHSAPREHTSKVKVFSHDAHKP
uniref:Uncharacterized protein n=1 Tax=Sphaerodactylus townsendi TaxID=933632 RepID=A0ACB8FFX4_9SAUR